MFHLHCLFSLFKDTVVNLLLIGMHLLWIASVCAVFVVVMFTLLYWITKRLLLLRHKIQHKNFQSKNLDVSIGFFHPYCNAGGGGERVLWCAVKAIQEKYPQVRCIIYTGDNDASPDEILKKAKQRFNISIDQPVEFIYLKWRRAVESDLYPHCTLLAQSLASMVLGFEALLKFVPTVYLDTMGYAFTIPIFKYLGSCRVGCYVHYPTISTDMLATVAKRRANYNNAGVIAKSPMLSEAKLFYYHMFAYFYAVVGKTCQLVMVNSSWTKMHILDLWRIPEVTFCVYPPCDVSSFEEIPIESAMDPKLTKNIVSVAQFRPEKDHTLQIRSFNQFLLSISENERLMYKLILIGGCRHSEDEELVKSELDVSQYVEFKLNISFDELKVELALGTIGLHTMWNEHFGIGVVECMAAGLVVLAHDSGGPKMDIVKQFNDLPTGFLAHDVDTYAEQMSKIFQMSSEEILKLKLNARESFLECLLSHTSTIKD
uniref:GDP-Man:Man(3)GlcNAc(2)-PP-Dol alpha-1,2-mannosyltransferase n=1 Tax=Strigamia maritima TaxID=126957 RepID=T1J3V9_STRMM